MCKTPYKERKYHAVGVGGGRDRGEQQGKIGTTVIEQQ